MAIKRISPKEARDLQAKGYVFIDVRSIQEYGEGHPAAALNVPWMLLPLGAEFPGGLAPNEEFVAVMSQRFAKDAKLICGCRSGKRSAAAAAALEAAGFTQVLDMRGGWIGETDATGKAVEQGWSTLGLPVEKVTEGGSWEEIRGR